MDISSVQSNIYTVPISSTALAAILNNPANTALVISGIVTVSTADTLIINNANLEVSGTGQIHQADGVGRTFNVTWYPEEPPEIIVGNELQVIAINSWDGVSFTGGWANMYMPPGPADFSNCVLPSRLWFGGAGYFDRTYSEYVNLENIVARRIIGKMNNCYIGHSDYYILSPVGSYNIIEYNNCGVGFHNEMGETQVGNIIRYNTALDKQGEVFCYDCDRGKANIGTFHIVSVDTAHNRIYIEGSDGGGYSGGPFGYKKGSICVLTSGAYFFVTLGAGNYIEVDVTGKYGAVALASASIGDPVLLQYGFVENYIYGNVWTKKYSSDPNVSVAGIALWGGCCGNEIYNNVGPYSYDVSVAVDNAQFDHSGESYGWSWPRMCANSSNHWYNNDFKDSYFWIASGYYDEQDQAVTANDVPDCFLNYNIVTENNINITFGRIYDALNVKWANGNTPVTTDYQEPTNVGKPMHVTFAAGSTVTYYSPPSKRVKLRSPSGGKIRGKGGLGKISGKPQ